MTPAGRPPEEELVLLADALARLAEGFAGLPTTDAPTHESMSPGNGIPGHGAQGDEGMGCGTSGHGMSGSGTFGADVPDREALAEALGAAAARMRDNYPYHHPLYAGQMLKPPHPAARLAYALSLWLNPNNHALDGGRASSAMEKEAVADLARMVGWETYLGHLCGGGTMANMEALWVAGRLAPGRIAVSGQAHYTHRRIGEVLGLDCVAVAADDRGRMDPDALACLLDGQDEVEDGAEDGTKNGGGGHGGRIGTVVATLGTTALGAVDPLGEILSLRDRHGFRLHVDAAYGGYFALASDTLAPEARAAFARMGEADSLVIDPHKHGLQPYGCGCVLFRDPSVGALYRHDSPYTYFTSDALHLGEISLECSRAGAAAVALWTTHRLLPPVPGGVFAGDLARCLGAARGLFAHLKASPRWLTVAPPETDIVVWAPDVRAPDARTRGTGDRDAEKPGAGDTDAGDTDNGNIDGGASSDRASGGGDGAAISAASRRVFEEAARRDLHLALVELPAALLRPHWPGIALDGEETVACLRSCLMKPEHLDWLGRITEILEEAADAAGVPGETGIASATGIAGAAETRGETGASGDAGAVPRTPVRAKGTARTENAGR